MQFRPFGSSGWQFSQLSFGASSLGQEFRTVDLNEALRSVQVALDLGMNFIDTSPFYGRGMSECLLGVALRGVPRDSYYLGTKIGRYGPTQFDFSAKRVVESVEISLLRMGVEHLDVVLCHDIEFVAMQQIVDQTLPALRKLKADGKVRQIGISGYPMKIFQFVLDQTELDCVLSYNHYTLQNTMLADLVPYLQSKQVAILNAAPFSARLLTNQPLPPWHKATPLVRETARRAAECCAAAGVDIAQLALQFSLRHPAMSSLVVGSANPANVRKWVAWSEQPLDEELLAQVQAILAPIHNWHYTEGRAENNDGGRKDEG